MCPYVELNRVFELGFRPLPWGDRGYLPSALQSLGEAAATASGRAYAPTLETLDLPERLREFLARIPTLSAADESASNLPAAADSAPDVRDLAKLIERKLSRFLFEQRGRVLAQLAGPAAETVPVKPFDLEAEDNALASLLAPLGQSHTPGNLLPGPASLKPPLAALNPTTLATLSATLAEGQKLLETPAQLAGRVKAVYRDANARAEAFALALKTTVPQTQQQ